MPEVDEYFVNDWSYDGFQTFLTAKKCSEIIWINSLKAISKNNNYPQSIAIFNLWSSLHKRMKNDRFNNEYILDINRLSNLLQKTEIHFLSNLFSPANVELDREVNEYLNNIFSIFKSKETFNAESIFEEVEQKRKLTNLGIKTSQECRITFIFITVQKL
ncbi:22987_t:CDS:2, partial [Cetraspora pellucida]